MKNSNKLCVFYYLVIQKRGIEIRRVRAAQGGRRTEGVEVG